MSSTRIRELAVSIAAAKREIKRIERTFKFDDIKKELKQLMLDNIPMNEDEQHSIEFGDANVRVVVFSRTQETADKKKAKKLLAHQTFHAIFKPKTSDVLKVSEIE